MKTGLYPGSNNLNSCCQSVNDLAQADTTRAKKPCEKDIDSSCLTLLKAIAKLIRGKGRPT